MKINGKKNLSSKEVFGAHPRRWISKAKEKPRRWKSFPIACYGLGGFDLQLWALHVGKNWNETPPNVWFANQSLLTGVSIWDSIFVSEIGSGIKPHLDDSRLEFDLQFLWVCWSRLRVFNVYASFQQNPIILILPELGVISTGILVRVKCDSKIVEILLKWQGACDCPFIATSNDSSLIARNCMILEYLVPGYYPENKL